jgi:hypothetical protein
MPSKKKPSDETLVLDAEARLGGEPLLRDGEGYLVFTQGKTRTVIRGMVSEYKMEARHGLSPYPHLWESGRDSEVTVTFVGATFKQEQV